MNQDNTVFLVFNTQYNLPKERERYYSDPLIFKKIFQLVLKKARVGGREKH